MGIIELIMDSITGYRNNFYGKTFHVLMVLLVYSSVIYFLSFITADPDLWGHLMFGKEIWASKTIPSVDMYSYTAFGAEWINHEWLSEVLMWQTFNLFGSSGLLIGKMIIGLITVSAISVISYNRKSHFISYGLVFVISIFIMSPGFMTRPQLATFLFTSLFFLVIHLYLEKRIDILWALPLIMILWVNSHGGFLIGAGILPIVVALEYVTCLIKKKDSNHLRNLILWTFITEVSMLINPYGFNLLVFLYKTLSLSRSISEWEAVSLFDLSYIRLKIFSICVILSFFIKRNKNRYWEIGIIIIAILFAFLHQRHTPVFAILAAPFLSEKLSGIVERIGLNEKVISLFPRVVLSIVIAFIIGYQLFATIDKHIKADFNIIVDPNIYPVRAIRFLKVNSIKGNLLVPFEWGEYTIWKLYPDSKVSIDGRFDTVYPADVINDHFDGAKSQEGWSSLLHKYPTDIILARRNSFSQRMINDLSDDWIYIYSDNISMIFLRNGEHMKEVIEKFNSKKLVYPKDELSRYFP
jgi:hypothetical protein